MNLTSSARQPISRAYLINGSSTKQHCFSQYVYPPPNKPMMLIPVVPAGNYFDAVQKFKARFCFFCSDPCNSKNSAICIRCGAIICIASRVGGAGCIGANTLEVERSSFECPVCIGSSKTQTLTLPYYLTGSGLRRTPKIAWPLLLLPMQLKNLDSLILKLVSLTMESNYVNDKECVRFPWKLLPLQH